MKPGQDVLPGGGTLIDPAETRTAQADHRTDQANTRTDDANTRTDQANTRTGEANTRTDEANSRTEQANTRTGEANTRVDEANTRAVQANARTEQAELRFENEMAQKEVLRASELSYRRLFEAARDGILILDFDTGRVADVNPYLVELLGFSHGEMVGKTVGELSPFKDGVANQGMLERLQREGFVRYEDLPLETRDGRRIAVEFVSNVYQSGTAKVIQCNIRDITERKRAEAQILDQLNELRRWQAVMLNQTDRRQELKREVNELARRLGEPIRYPSQPPVANGTPPTKP